MKVILLFLSTIITIAAGVLSFSLFEYYDMESICLVGIPLLLIVRFADNYIRDFIIDKRHNQRLVATFITTLTLSIFIAISYFLYTNIFNHMDIYKVIIETLNIEQLLPYIK